MGFPVLFYSCHCHGRHISVMCFRVAAATSGGARSRLCVYPSWWAEFKVFKVARYRRRDVAALDVLSM